MEEIGKSYLPDTAFPARTVDKEKCARCGRCIEACPTGGFVKGKDGFPEPVGYGGFKEACINCWNCVAMCPEGAINLEGPFAIKEGPYKSRLTGVMDYPRPIAGDTRPYAEIEESLTGVERVIYTRRSNRLFKKKEVPKELLHRIIEAGRFAPSAGNCQPVKVVVITDQALISEIENGAMKVLRLFKNLYLEKTGKRKAWRAALFGALTLFMAGKTDPRPFTAMDKADKDKNVIYWHAPAVIFILKNKVGISNPDLDCGMCAQNMVLAAHSLGLGTCYIGLAVEPLGYPQNAALRRKLGIVHPWEAVTSIAVGWPKGKIDGIVKRDTFQVEWK
ncbi:MAG: nitroreductase family protein [Deltaproteobacteria bacterium]|nr:nitroreductase family protein [Deltaproteobacteria bacterium]